MRRHVAALAAGTLLATGCLANTYQIPHGDLAQIAVTPPEVRGERVRVVQELGGTAVPGAQPVGPQTQVVIGSDITITDGGSRPHWGGRRDGGVLGAVKGGGGKSGSSGKDAAIAILVVAAVALVAIASVEGVRFDGWAQLHPMHPVHLIGRDGGYRVMPLAWIDPRTAAWAEKAIVRESEGPWRPLERHPLRRAGPTYSMYGGTGSLRSADGGVSHGPAFTVQAGYFPTQEVGIVGSVFFGWRTNRELETLYMSRYTLELQAMPLALGRLHGGFYAGAGAAYRFEDGLPDGDAGSSALTGGAMFQLDVNTRIAITARLGLAKSHDAQTNDILVGLSVY